MGSGNCSFWAPGVFDLDDDGIAIVLDADRRARRQDRARRAGLPDAGDRRSSTATPSSSEPGAGRARARDGRDAAVRRDRRSACSSRAAPRSVRALAPGERDAAGSRDQLRVSVRRAPVASRGRSRSATTHRAAAPLGGSRVAVAGRRLPDPARARRRRLRRHRAAPDAARARRARGRRARHLGGGRPPGSRRSRDGSWVSGRPVRTRPTRSCTTSTTRTTRTPCTCCRRSSTVTVRRDAPVDVVRRRHHHVGLLPVARSTSTPRPTARPAG